MTKKLGDSFSAILRVISKAILGLITILIIGVIIIIVYFNYNKEKITNNVVNLVNTKIQGEFNFNNVKISPLAQFPHISISLNDVSYYNNIITGNDSVKDKILELENVHFAFNVISLFTNSIRIYGIKLENGNIDLIRYSDSTINFIDALKRIKIENQNIKTDSSTTTSSEIKLSLDYSTLENIKLNFKDEILKSTSKLNIKKIHCSFKSTDDSITFKIESKLQLDYLPIVHFIEIKNSSLSINSNMSWSMVDSTLKIELANIQLDKSKFKSSGIIKLSGQKSLDINFSLFDNDLSIANLFLSQKGIENIDKGSVYFNGKITHKFTNKIPEFDCNFGIRDIELSNPSSNSYIENLNIKGSFNTGRNGNLKEGHLVIDTLYATIPNGKLHGSLLVKNFILPKFNTNIDAELNIGGIDKILGTAKFEDTRGRISLQVNLSGEKTNDTTWIIPNGNQVNINLDNVSCNIPKLLELKKLNGIISGSIDNIKLNNLDILAGNSDFNINGKILNISQLIKGGSAIPEARLKIISNRFDLPESMSWIPTVRKDFREQFPYSIININVEAIASITREAILNSTIMPKMHIDVPYCFAQIDEFLPPVKVSNGFLQFVEVGSGYSIDINDFDIQFKEASLYGGCTYYDKRGEYDSLDIKADISSLNPDYIVNYYSVDSSSVLDSLDIAGNVIFRINFSGFDTVREKSFAYINLQKLIVRQIHDTTYCNSLSVEIGEVYYNSTAVDGALSALGANIKLDIDNISSSNIDLEGIKTEIDVDEGEFDIRILSSSSLLQAGKGSFVIAPFVKTPYFQLDYSLDEFRFEDIFEGSNKPPLVKGILGTSISIGGKGESRNGLSESIHGHINLNGEHLKLMGLNLDNIIRKLNRTQNFNLADVGAVIVAGPLGLLISKGADVSSLLINKKHDSTEIIQLVSEWNIEKGIMELSDVAFSTPKNRIAAKGKYSFPTDSIAIVIAVVDKKGKIELQQTITGTTKHPKLSVFKPLNAILKPVSNLFNDVLFIKGETFYNGKVLPPQNKKNN